MRVESSFKNSFSPGWALDKEVVRKMDPDVTEEDKNDQKLFIKELFDYGLNPNNKKVSPLDAVLKMRWARKPNGERRFLRKMWLKESQISSLFGRYAAELKKKSKKVSEEEVEDGIEDYEAEVKRDVIQVMAHSLAQGAPLEDQECPLMVSHSF